MRKTIPKPSRVSTRKRGSELGLHVAYIHLCVHPTCAHPNRKEGTCSPSCKARSSAETLQLDQQIQHNQFQGPNELKVWKSLVCTFGAGKEAYSTTFQGRHVASCCIQMTAAGYSPNRARHVPQNAPCLVRNHEVDAERHM
eukprot:2544292-Amphidinium_carterae.1